MKTNAKNNNPIFHISRIFIGLIFVFSGFVKAVDPLGSTYKFQDYFNAFGGAWTHLSQFAFVLTIALSTIELVIGLNLIFAIKTRFTALATVAFMLIMTALTLYIALKNPVSDCGCFGDALVITNWQTFGKNIVIDLVLIALLLTSKKLKPLFKTNIEWIIVALFSFVGIFTSIYAYRNLPQIDFLPYKKGINIAAEMAIPADAPKDEYATTFIYEKNGTQKEFTLENYPEGDSTWTFIDQKTALIKEGFKPAIHNFIIYNEQNEDIVPELIEHKGYSYLLVMYDITKCSAEGAQKAEAIYQKYKNTSLKFYALTASSDEEVAEYASANKLTFPFYECDPITLKTIIRANPGLVLIKDGVIVGKWHWRNF